MTGEYWYVLILVEGKQPIKGCHSLLLSWKQPRTTREEASQRRAWTHEWVAHNCLVCGGTLNNWAPGASIVTVCIMINHLHTNYSRLLKCYGFIIKYNKINEIWQRWNMTITNDWHCQKGKCSCVWDLPAIITTSEKSKMAVEWKPIFVLMMLYSASANHEYTAIKQKEYMRQQLIFATFFIIITNIYDSQ